MDGIRAEKQNEIQAEGEMILTDGTCSECGAKVQSAYHACTRSIPVQWGRAKWVPGSDDTAQLLRDIIELLKQQNELLRGLCKQGEN